MQKSVNITRHLTSVSWGMNPKIINVIFNATITSHYGLKVNGKCVSWYRKLQKFSQKKLKIIKESYLLHANKLIEADIPPILVRLKYLTEKLYVNIFANKMYANMYKTNNILQGEHLEQLKCRYL